LINATARKRVSVKEVGGKAWVHPGELFGRIITSQNHGAPTRDLPSSNPHFIALHASISLILHMSGTAEVFERILGKYEGGNINTRILKSNGNPVHQLSPMVSALSIGVPLIA
jgi:hypothetical protein